MGYTRKEASLRAEFGLKKGEVFLIKLTTARGVTKNSCQWGPNVTNTAKERGCEPCTSSVIHAYRTVKDAIVNDRTHGKYTSPRNKKHKGWALWLAKGIPIKDSRLWYNTEKVCCKSLTTLVKLAGGKTHPYLFNFNSVSFSLNKDNIRLQKALKNEGFSKLWE